MHEAGQARPGAMAAVMAELAVVRQAVEAAGPGVVIANINAPEQIIVSGETDAVQAAIEKLKELGVKRVVPLPVSGAFHSPLMAGAIEPMRAAFASVSFAEPAFPVVANVTAEPGAAASAIPGLLLRQITGQVRWVETMQRLKAMGAELFLEVGSGKVLAGLAKRIDREMNVLPCGTPEEIEKAAEAAK